EILDPDALVLASPALSSPPGNAPDITPGDPAPPVGQLGSAEAHVYNRDIDQWDPAQAAPVDAGPAGAVGRIAIVGAPGAGKTTFAAALNLAALSHAGAHAYWSLHRAPMPEDPRLLRAISQLLSGRFPSPVEEDVEPLEFRLVGHVEDVRSGLFTGPER